MLCTPIICIVLTVHVVYTYYMHCFDNPCCVHLLYALFWQSMLCTPVICIVLTVYVVYTYYMHCFDSPCLMPRWRTGRTASMRRREPPCSSTGWSAWSTSSTLRPSSSSSARSSGQGSSGSSGTSTTQNSTPYKRCVLGPQYPLFDIKHVKLKFKQQENFGHLLLRHHSRL